MHGAAANRADVIERLAEQHFPFFLAAGHGSEAEFVGAPAPQSIDAEYREIIAFDRRFHLDGRNVVGKLQLDCLEPRRRRRADAIDHSVFGAQVAEIGGETWHGLSCAPLRASVMPYSLATHLP